VLAPFALARPPTSTTSSSTAGRFANARRSPRRNFGRNLGTHLCPSKKRSRGNASGSIGTGAYGRLPVMEEVKREAERRKIALLIAPTSKAIQLIEKDPAANAILHVTC